MRRPKFSIFVQVVMVIGDIFTKLAMPTMDRHSLKGRGKTGAVDVGRVSSMSTGLIQCNGPRMKVGPIQIYLSRDFSGATVGKGGRGAVE